MAVRAARRRMGLNVRVMRREIVNRRALENVIANDIAGLMRAAASHDCALHRKQFNHAWQLLFQKLLVTLMRQRIAGLKTLLRLPRPPFFHHRASLSNSSMLIDPKRNRRRFNVIPADAGI